MVILPGSMSMCRLQELRRRFEDFRRALIGQSNSISHRSANSRSGHVAPSFTLQYLRFSTCNVSDIGKRQTKSLPGLLLLILGAIFSQTGAQANPAIPYGLTSRPATQPYLGMPPSDQKAPPRLLSQTGAFTDTRELTPSDALIPYDINLPFYSDGAMKSRWVSIPSQGGFTNIRIRFAATGEWQFPAGTVFVKHFEMNSDETQTNVRRRLETRLLMCDAKGGVYGVSYKWRPDNSDAELVSSNLTETLSIRTTMGFRTQTWYYPSRQDCKTCHTSTAGGVLGLKTRQINRDFCFPSGTVDNQLRSWNHIGLFDVDLKETDLASYARLAAAKDLNRSLEDRARSYLDVNCAYCHRPGGTVAYFDARYDTQLERQNLINGQV